jgi:hypothetical protein
VAAGGPVRHDVAANTCVGHLGVEFGGQFVQIGRVVVGFGGVVAHVLGFGAEHGPPFLGVVGFVGADGGFVREVPAFAALGCAQVLVPVRAGWADGGEGVAAGDQDLLYLAGVQVGAP